MCQNPLWLVTIFLFLSARVPQSFALFCLEKQLNHYREINLSLGQTYGFIMTVLAEILYIKEYVFLNFLLLWSCNYVVGKTFLRYVFYRELVTKLLFLGNKLVRKRGYWQFIHSHLIFSAMAEDIVVPVLNQGAPLFESLLNSVLDCSQGRYLVFAVQYSFNNFIYSEMPTSWDLKSEDWVRIALKSPWILGEVPEFHFSLKNP